MLAAGGWPEPTTDAGRASFFAGRFLLHPTAAIINVIYPCLEQLRGRAEELLAQRGKVLPSVRSMISVLEYLAVVVFQDALELADTYEEAGVSSNPCLQRLLNHPDFRERLAEYRRCRSEGVSGAARPPFRSVLAAAITILCHYVLHLIMANAV